MSTFVSIKITAFLVITCLISGGFLLPDASALTAQSVPVVVSDYYTELVSHKAEFVDVVSERVEQYRNGTPPENPNHYPPYPEHSFPDAASLPIIDGVEDFSIRQDVEHDAMLGIYIAVKIDDDHEMRMDMFKVLGKDGEFFWGSGNVYFSQKGDKQFDHWVLEDITT